MESVIGKAATATQVQFFAITGNIFKSSVRASAVRRTDNTILPILNMLNTIMAHVIFFLYRLSYIKSTID